MKPYAKAQTIVLDEKLDRRCKLTESDRTLGIAARGFGSCADDLAQDAVGFVQSAGKVAKSVVGLIAEFCGKDIF